MRSFKYLMVPVLMLVVMVGSAQADWQSQAVAKRLQVMFAKLATERQESAMLIKDVHMDTEQDEAYLAEIYATAGSAKDEGDGHYALGLTVETLAKQSNDSGLLKQVEGNEALEDGDIHFDNATTEQDYHDAYDDYVLSLAAYGSATTLYKSAFIQYNVAFSSYRMAFNWFIQAIPDL